MIDLPTRRWKEGEIYYADNGIVRLAYVIDADRAGTEGWHGPKKIWVEYRAPDDSGQLGQEK